MEFLFYCCHDICSHQVYQQSPYCWSSTNLQFLCHSIFWAHSTLLTIIISSFCDTHPSFLITYGPYILLVIQMHICVCMCMNTCVYIVVQYAWVKILSMPVQSIFIYTYAFVTKSQIQYFTTQIEYFQKAPSCYCPVNILLLKEVNTILFSLNIYCRVTNSSKKWQGLLTSSLHASLWDTLF